MSIQSKCINCDELHPCIKIEARAPLAQPVLVWDSILNCHQPVEYETSGPMVEICRECLHNDMGTLAKYLVEDL